MWKKIEEKSPWLPIAQEKSYQNNDIIDWYDWIDKLNREKWEIINTLKPQTIVQPIETYISWKKLIIWSLLIALFILFFLWLLWFLFPNFLQKSVTNNYTLTGITANQTIPHEMKTIKSSQEQIMANMFLMLIKQTINY